jgi:uncharacterized membrane protein
MDNNNFPLNEDLRATARQQLQGVWGKMALAYFVYFLIYTPYLISSGIDAYDNLDLGESSNSPITTILSLVIAITSGAFALGFVGFFLKRVRGQEIAIKNIFDGFNRFGSAFLLSLFTGLFVMLWTLLLIVPGIIKAFGYSMGFYILHDNPGMSTFEALKKSQIMMKGHKADLFFLELSFIGWILLGLLTLGIGWLWVYPYMSLSIANFYENLKKEQEEAIEIKAPKGVADAQANP